MDDLATVVLQFTDFCAGLKLRTSTKPSDIIREALKLDADLVAAVVGTAPTLTYTVIHITDLSGKSPKERTVWGNSYHAYNSITASSMWNNYRSARILLREIIIDTLHATSDAGVEQDQPFVNECRQMGKQLVDDICASVPSYLDPSLLYAEPSMKPTTTCPGNGRRSSPSTGAAMGAGGCITLLWPLLIAANSGFAPSEQREWITGCFDRIGRATGIGQASAMAQLLRDQRSTRTWLTAKEGTEELDL